MATAASQSVKVTERAEMVAAYADQMSLRDFVKTDLSDKIQDGDSLTITGTMPNYEKVVKGILEEADYQRKVTRGRPITLDYYNAPGVVGLADADLSIAGKFEEAVALPAARSLSRSINELIFNSCVASASTALVTTTPTFAALRNAVAAVRDTLVSGEISGLLSNSLMAAISNSGNQFFFDSESGKNYREFEIARFAGANFASTIAAKRIVGVAIGTAVSSYVEGSATIAIANENLVEGTVIPAGTPFHLAGIYAADMMGVSLGYLKVITTTADHTVTAAEVTADVVNLPITPLWGANSAGGAAANVVTVPTNQAVTALLTAGSTYEKGIVFAKDCVELIGRQQRTKDGKCSNSNKEGMLNVQYWEHTHPFSGEPLINTSTLAGAGAMIDGGYAIYAQL